MSNLVRQAPRFSERQAAALAENLFNLSASAEGLPSERDQNFRLQDGTGGQFVLKIANAAETREVLELQNRAMTHVAEQGAALFDESAPCPRVLSAPGGEEILSIPGQDGASHFVRLLTYLPGKPLATVNPHDRDLLFSLGFFLGNIDRAFMNFDHPATHRAFHWDLARCGEVVGSMLDNIDDAEKRDLVRHLFDRYCADTAPKLAGLRTSVIHSDGNDYNVLASPYGRWGNRVTGLIDFGDMVHSHTINELAIACAYALMGKRDPLTAAVQVVAGYHRAFALGETELAVLFDLICMRLCTSVCHSAHQIRLAPQNTYLLISQQPAWELLFRLREISPAFAEALFRDACGFDPVPRSRFLAAWLKENQSSFTPVVDVSLPGDHPPVIDLSVSTPLLGAGPEKGDAEAMTRLIFREMEDAGSALGIGRYNEARLIYTADAFKVETDTAPEYRTVHLGLDLFARPGQPVYAFMDGRIHSVQNNDAHQDYGPTLILSHETDTGIPFYSLYGHLAATSLDALEPGMAIRAGQTLGAIGTSKENGGWAPHLHFQLITDLLGFEGSFPGVARPSQRRVWTALCPDPGVVLGLAFEPPATEVRQADEIMAIRQRHLGKNLSVSYRTPLKIVRGMGGFLYTETGQPYMDGVNNVCHVGHCHPAVVAAGQRQMAVLNTNTRYLHDNIVDYARRLLATFPDPLSVCFFVCSGSEANELALRLARTHTGQGDIITVDGAYHGNTQGLVDISPYKHDGPGGKGAPDWVQTVVMPCGYRGPHKGTGPESGIAYARYVKTAVDCIQAAGRRPAAFICESMLGCGGQVLLPDGYLRAAFAHVRAAGGVCIADEVQVGFGRAGTHFWAFETQGVVPDIVTLGKPMGNGHPVAAVVTTPEIAGTFNNGMEYFNTYGGNPVSCAVGMAVMDVIQTEDLQENARQVGAYLLERLSTLKENSPLIGDVRGLGLYLGVELVTDHDTLAPAADHAAYICNRMKDYGFLISTDGPLHNVLKIKPPIVFSMQDADALVDALENVFEEDCLWR
ncbi:aminotransferase class III-fold pyridoxal phosphate-dependent enzyme [uncultured Desulfosarcina sp.]|uniref:aminotransferase class III-fold pyridoxal phosphate-dependent enzyme n=1 Tax=uncultured Desulfosarcina sp. TaxID=218289 RepID=UPI0029C6304F|nr:aminotransferase class III-fold pyridoxal phosphate-dependent enzyme [uncultured Desulfosarcina sp.]